MVYTGVLIVFMSLIPEPNTGLSIGLNGAGAFIMTMVFWNKYIGKETKFRVKPIWKPLVISILITIPFLLAIIYG